jgi:hypothetical protein
MTLWVPSDQFLGHFAEFFQVSWAFQLAVPVAEISGFPPQPAHLPTYMHTFPPLGGEMYACR